MTQEMRDSANQQQDYYNYHKIVYAKKHKIQKSHQEPVKYTISHVLTPIPCRHCGHMTINTKSRLCADCCVLHRHLLKGES